MWLFYFLVFLVFFVYALCSNLRNGEKFYLFIMFGIFGILMMFRGETVGNDTDRYIDIFNVVRKTSNLQTFIESSRYEKGYIYLNWVLSLISDNPQILFIVTGAFTAFSFGRFIYKYSINAWMSVLMFLTLQFFDLTLTGVRQIVAIAVLLFSYDYLISRKLWRFLLLVFIASTIHTSTILFLIFYPLTSKKRGAFFYISSTAIAVFIYVSFRLILPIAGRLFPQYLKYLEGEGGSYSIEPKLGVFLMLALWLILFVCAKVFGREQPSDISDDISQNGSMPSQNVNYVHEIAVWMGIIMLFLALQGTILNRFKYIFSVPIIVYFPNMLKTMDIGTRRIITIATCIVFILYSIIIYTYRPEWQSTYPYTFFWQENF